MRDASFTPPFNSIFFWQRLFSLRLFERKQEQKFQTASSPDSLQFIKVATANHAGRLVQNIEGNGFS
jgi:hypothetical protein